MNKSVFFGLLLFSNLIHAETIRLTCRMEVSSNSVNYTFVSPTNTSKGKFYLNDKDQDYVDEYGSKVVKEVTITNSEIKVADSYRGKYLSSVSNATINRTDGNYFRIDNFADGSILVVNGKCMLRKVNKF